MKLKEKINSKKRTIVLIFLISITIILFLTGFSMGKELTIVNGNIQAQVAKPILIVENGKNINITSENRNGNFDFTIKNYNELNEISRC